MNEGASPFEHTGRRRIQQLVRWSFHQGNHQRGMAPGREAPVSPNDPTVPKRRRGRQWVTDRITVSESSFDDDIRVCLSPFSFTGISFVQDQAPFTTGVGNAAAERRKPEGEMQIYAAVPRGKHPVLPNHCRIVREIGDSPSPHEELLLTFYLPESSLEKIRGQLRTWYEKGGRVVRISSLSHLAITKEFPDLILKTCMPLPVCNSFAAAELAGHGVSLVQGSLELGAEEWRLLAEKSPLPCELYCYGRPVLLSTRANLPVRGEMSDSKGERFRVEKNGARG